jgi:hypothetical protein
MLVAKPAIGKSTAINRGMDIIQQMKERGLGYVNILPQQITEAKLIEVMATPGYFEYGPEQVPQCTGYFSVSEASACLKDITGSTGLVSTITALYDCDKIFEKATVSMGDRTQKLVNICFNMIGGATFDYLGKLVTNENIQGGFASRLLYIIQSDFWERKVSFQDKGRVKNTSIDHEHLISDLGRINKIIGPFSGDKAFGELWNNWFKVHDRELQENPSESMQSLLSRKHTSITKLPMILSAAESNDRILKAHHFEKSLSLIEEIEKDLPGMLRTGKANELGHQTGINNAIFSILEKQKSRSMNKRKLVTRMVTKGFERSLTEKTLETFSATEAGILKLENSVVTLVGNPNDYL